MDLQLHRGSSAHIHTSHTLGYFKSPQSPGHFIICSDNAASKRTQSTVLLISRITVWRKAAENEE